MNNENFVNRAFNDCSEKIKKLAKILFIIGLVAGVVVAIVMFIVASNTWRYEALFRVIGLASPIVIPLLTWISCMFLYGFGELIEKASSIDRKMNSSGNAKSETQAKIDNERIAKLERLRSQGLITEEEYQTALSKN